LAEKHLRNWLLERQGYGNVGKYPDKVGVIVGLVYDFHGGS
jgi:hypothetical protein